MISTFTYTVTITHYNRPELLKRMLDSIPERDDIQVVVVDDGSDEDAVNEIKTFKHNNLELVLMPENHGGGYERNVGLEHAKGKWLLAVDADDIFDSSAFDVLDKYTDSDYDYVCYCVTCLDGDTLKPTGHHLRSDDSVRAFLKKSSKRNIKLLKFWNTEPWNKMVSLKFLHDNSIRWEPVRINMDVAYTYQLSLKAKKIKIIPNELYHFVGDSNSVTRKTRSIEREFGFYIAAQKRNGFFGKLGYGWPFYKYDFLYLPYLLKKRGVKETFEFYKYRHLHWDEVLAARKAYLPLLEGVDKRYILDINK